MRLRGLPLRFAAFLAITFVLVFPHIWYAPVDSFHYPARLFKQVVDALTTHHVANLERKELYRIATEAILRELGDPHTVLLDPNSFEELRTQTEGDYHGIGIEIDLRDNAVTVIAPIRNSPAQRAGILAGDRIRAIDGERTEGWTTTQAVHRIRGPDGSTVTLDIERPGQDSLLRFTIQRESIRLPALSAAYLMDHQIGYIELRTFTTDASKELKAAIDSLRGEGMRRLILDLRNNPGGLLTESVAVADLFLPKHAVITESRGRIGTTKEVFRARDNHMYEDLPVAVLVGPQTASAAEIVAGALQDHDRAIIIGERTYGKGSIQTLYPLSGGYWIKITTARWHTPSGRAIDIPSDSIQVDSAPTFRSRSGRPIRGGGGIWPDVLVHDSLLIQEETLIRAVRGAWIPFIHAIDSFVALESRVPERPNEELWPRFRHYLRQRGVPVPEYALADLRSWLELYLRYHITKLRYGENEAIRLVNAHDPVVARAQEILASINSVTDLMLLTLKLSGETARQDGDAPPLQ